MRAEPENVERALDVAIVSYRSRALLHACLQSLLEYKPAGPMHVVVVDNDSRDGTAEMLGEDFPEVDSVVLSENRGFSAPTNIAIARGTAEYVLVLNPDTRMRPGVLDYLLDLMEDHPEVAISGCRLEREDGSFDHASRRSFPTPLGALGHFSGLGRNRWAPSALGQYRAPGTESGPVDAVNGAFMLIRRAAIEKVGLFDEDYWLYMEDLDLCYRLAEAGWIIWYSPQVAITHVKGGSSGPNRLPRVNYAFHYGMYRFYRKHYAPKRSQLFNSLIYGGIALKLCLSIVRSALARRVLPLFRS